MNTHCSVSYYGGM